MDRCEAEDVRRRAATLVQRVWSGGYKRAWNVGGAVFVPVARAPHGGWRTHKEDNDSAES